MHLRDYKFDRIVCDEAHYIRNTKSKTFKNLYQINSDIRWALTGTPIQNYKKDLISLFIFLRKEDANLKILTEKYMLRRTIEKLNFNLPFIEYQNTFILNHNLKLIKTINVNDYMHHLEKL